MEENILSCRTDLTDDDDDDDDEDDDDDDWTNFFNLHYGIAYLHYNQIILIITKYVTNFFKKRILNISFQQERTTNERVSHH